MALSIAILIAVLAAVWIMRHFWRHRSLYPFLPRRYDFGKRRNSFRKTLSLLDEIGAQTLIETGVARYGLQKTRGDGASTAVFGLWAHRNGAVLHAVDIDPEAIAQAGAAARELGIDKSVMLHASDSVAWLAAFEGQVDFAYLDSFDYFADQPELARQSQEHHLAEFRAIEHRLSSNAVVLIDDCALPGGGKGRMVIDYMLSVGWTPILEGYQVLLRRKEVA
jgi:SAM-dependent methyltransferase